jgi:hypothetical protein
MTRRGVVPAIALVALSVSAQAAQAQFGTLEASYGGWKPDSVPLVTWTVGVRRPLVGSLNYTLALSHVGDRATPQDRTHTGAELVVGWGRDGSGVYAVAGVGAGMKHDDGNLDAWWATGIGWAVRVLPFVSLGVEARYRLEDQFNRGFWSLSVADRRGPSLSISAALVSARGRPPRRVPPPPPPYDPPGREAGFRDRGGEGGGAGPGRELAADVVQTALQAMGTPYRWGGEGANGYDCSGLIQYAYGQHGIILPRVSREQARLGIAVERGVASLHAGDILGFSVEGPGVTHVGLYIGEGQFIHSASGGVKLSSLTAGDADSAWWQRRWVQSRRILQ